MDVTLFPGDGDGGEGGAVGRRRSDGWSTLLGYGDGVISTPWLWRKSLIPNPHYRNTAIGPRGITTFVRPASQLKP